MNKWLLILILIMFGLCAIVSNFSTAPADIASELADAQRYQAEMAATAAAATPNAVEILNENRYGRYEYGVETQDGDFAWAFVILLLIVFDSALVIILLAQNAEGPLKQLRLLQKQLSGGRRSLPAGRTRTIPQIPYINQQPNYRQLPEQTGQMPQEVDWYE